MPRKSRVDELREKFEAAIEKGLVSESAAERTQALRSAGDMLNPNLTDLQKQLKQAEDDREASDSALKTAQTVLDAANAKITELEPLIAQVAELTTFKAGIDEWKAEQVRALTEEARQHESQLAVVAVPLNVIVRLTPAELALTFFA
jgi:ABC-type transporter Mla subunit MlaD